MADCLADAASARCCLPDGFCQMPSARQLSGRRYLADTVSAADGLCQMPRLPDSLAEVSARRRICSLADSIWLTQCMADTVCQMPSARMSDTVCQTASARCRLPDGFCQMPSARQLPGRRWHLADTVSAADGLCQMPRLPDSLAEVSARRRICHSLADSIWLTQYVSGIRRLPDGPMPDCLADRA